MLAQSTKPAWNILKPRSRHVFGQFVHDCLSFLYYIIALGKRVILCTTCKNKLASDYTVICSWYEQMFNISRYIFKNRISLWMQAESQATEYRATYRNKVRFSRIRYLLFAMFFSWALLVALHCSLRVHFKPSSFRKNSLLFCCWLLRFNPEIHEASSGESFSYKTLRFLFKNVFFKYKKTPCSSKKIRLFCNFNK